MRGASQIVVAFVFAFSTALLAVTWGWQLRPLADNAPPAGQMVELRVRAVVASEDGELNAVMLVPKAGEEPMLPVFVERSEASAIVSRLEKEDDGVPHATDAMRSLISSMGAKVERVAIEGIDPLASRGRIFLSQGNRSFELPVGGAVCIEMAIVEKVPLVIEQGTLDKLGITKEDLERMGRGEEPKRDDRQAPGAQPAPSPQPAPDARPPGNAPPQQPPGQRASPDDGVPL